MKGIQTIQMYSAADTDAAAVIDLPDDGELLAVTFDCRAILPNAADSEFAAYEVSFGSTSAFTSNDARQVIASMIISNDFTSAVGGTRSDKSMRYSFEGGLEVFAGERIYLHVAVGAGGDNAVCRVHLLFKFKGGTTRRR